ncbi:MAG TPA: hypothetical protein VIG24_08995 [Acidimicrobiia bacterium]
MGDKLTPAEEAQLRFLRREERAQDEAFASDPHPDAATNHYHARDALRRYVARLRKKGRKV